MEVKTIPVPSGRPAIQSYGPDGFRISGTLHKGPILVLSDGVVEWHTSLPLGLNGFAQAIEHRDDFDLLLIGCGNRPDGMEQGLAIGLRAKGLPCEAMGTGAACRTYNLLAAEGRRVAAALLPPR